MTPVAPSEEKLHSADSQHILIISKANKYFLPALDQNRYVAPVFLICGLYLLLSLPNYDYYGKYSFPQFRGQLSSESPTIIVDTSYRGSISMHRIQCLRVAYYPLRNDVLGLSLRRAPFWAFCVAPYLRRCSEIVLCKDGGMGLWMRLLASIKV